MFLLVSAATFGQARAASLIPPQIHQVGFR